MTSFTNTTTNYPTGADTPIRRVISTRNPTSSDYKNFELGDEWLNKSTQRWWKVSNLTASSAKWVPMATTTAGAIETVTGDSGGAIPPATSSANLNLVGTAGQITVTGNSATNTLTLALAGGGTAIDSFVPDSGTNPVVPTAAGAVTMSGSGSITTVGGLNSLTTQLTGLTNHAVLVGAGTTTITKVGPSATTGAAFISGGAAADPGFSTTFTINDATPITTLSKASAGSTVTFSTQNTSTNTALISSTANSAGNGAGYFSSGQYDTTKYWNFGMVPTNAGTNPGGYNISYNTVGQADPSGGTNTVRITTTGGISVPSGDLSVSRSNVGGNVALALSNTDNTNASSAAVFTTAVGGTSGGSPMHVFNIPSGSDWTIGADNGQSDRFSIAQSTAALNTNPVFLASTTGAVTIPMGDLTVSRASTGDVYCTATNTNVSAAANAALTASTATGGGDPFVAFNCAAVNATIGLDQSDSQKMKFGYGGTPSASTNFMIATVAGEVTMPLQPAFGAYLSAATTNDKTGDGTTYTVICNTEEYDQNGDYDNTTGVFTAPVAGKYLFCWTCELANLGAGHTSSSLYLTTSGAGYQSNVFNIGAVRDSNNNAAFTMTQIISLAASATVTPQILVAGGAKTVGIVGGTDGSGRKLTYFSGALIC